MPKLEVASGKAVKLAITWYETINDWFKSFGIVTGGLAASMADWVFGTITMSVLLSRYPEWSDVYIKYIVGAVFSLALWGIQIILWQLILTGQIGKINNNKTYTFWVYVAVFFIVIIMKFGDDISDLFGVYWLIRDNPMRDVLTPSLYGFLQNTIMFLAWVVCGFSEIIMAFSINLLKADKGETQNNPQNAPNQPKSSAPKNVHNPYGANPQFQAKQHKHHGQERRSFLEQNRGSEKLTSDTQPKIHFPFRPE